MNKPLGRFLLQFAIIFLLLVLPWPGWEQAYAGMFRTVAGTLFGSLGPRAVVLFAPLPKQRGSPVDTSMNVGDRRMVTPKGTLSTVNQEFSTRYVGYMPAALLTALVLATPLPWRRRGWALLWGLVLVHLFVGGLILIMILYLSNHTEWLTILKLPGFLLPLLDLSWNTFIFQVVARFLIPVLIWILVAFRAGDLHELLGLHDN